MPSKENEKDNYNCIMEIMNVAVCEGLREIFKQEWDKHYGTTKGVWDDTCISGNELYNMEKGRPAAKRYLHLFRAGKRSDWDVSALSDAILYSNAFKMHLVPHVSNKVDELRDLRNKLMHPFASKGKMPDAAFKNAYKKVKNCFNVLLLSTAEVDSIRNSWKGQPLTCSRNVGYICLTIFIIIGLISRISYHWFTNGFEDKSLFRDLPTRPVHLVANRTRTVNAIVDELRNLSIRNNRALTYLYISGNPGSGKSQLARIVGETFGTTTSHGSFVMTLNGRSLHDILESYVDFSRRVDCDKDSIASIINSNQTTTVTKIQRLRTEIAKFLKTTKIRYTWLLIVDNVVKLSEISSFLPQLEDEDWKGGQVLITTQDMSSVPPNSSSTVHISVSQGMDPAESFEFLTHLSGFVENQDLVSKVAKELDYQPLALASAAFYVKILRKSKASPQFTWKDYLKKLSEGKRNLTEMKLNEVNEPAYSLTMSTAVLLAVKTFAENDSVLKHVFTFLSYVSHEPLTLDLIVSYALRVDKNYDQEDVGLKIRQCSLILPSDDQKVVSILLHRVVHDSIKLYIANVTEKNTKSSVPLDVLQLLLRHRNTLGEIALTPHLKAFCARTKTFSSEILVRGSKKIKQEMQEQIFYLTSTLIEYGEFLLSKNLLILAVKIATNGRDKDNLNLNFNKISYISFPKIGEIFLNLGNVESNLGNITKSKEYHVRALEIFLKQYGRSHEYVAISCMNIASLSSFTCLNPKECNEGIKYCQLALEIDDRHEIKGICYMNRGRLQYVQDNLQEAEKYYLQALETLWKTVHPNGTCTVYVATHLALVMTNLGVIKFDRDMHEEGKQNFKLSIDMYRRANGQNHLGLADSYNNLGQAHFTLNELPDAEECFRRALEIYSQQLEPSHEKIAMISRSLAAVLEETGQSSEAADLEKRYGSCRRQNNPSVSPLG